uniref:von Willebrand factor A domain-containing protein 1 n=1 Tax=Leptobrachium leishanense TaxID=445787 RepID=A0A8C5WE80_9ANUR
MIVCLALYLHSLYLVALGQTIPISEPPSLAPDAEGDLLFLLDSSGSVSYHEFAKVKEFIGDLLGPFTFGPRDVQASIVHISTEPSLEFTFNQHGSGQEVQKAIQDIKQLMGDTNTGKALSYVKENLLAGTFGSRTDVPKVMVWVTDGLSTDDISRPMQLLKDLGVTVFIVSTGGGNYLELSEAASQPSETHLHFVDVDDLPIITKELRDSIIDLIRAKRLHAHDITTTSFRLTWPMLLTQVREESYLLEYSLESDVRRRTQKTLSADQIGVFIGSLSPNTTYWVTLTPESNVQYFHPQTIQVTTLPEPIQELTLQVHDVTTTSFRVTWAKVLSPVKDEVYVLEYSVESGAQERIRKILPGDQTTLVLGNLTPNTTYRVTLSPKSNLLFFRPQSIHVSTLPEPIQEIPVRVSDITTSGFRLTWPHLLSAVNEDIYLLEYSPESDIKRTIWKTLPGAQTSVVLDNLSPNTVYRVTLTPKFNVRYIQPKTLLVSTLPEPLKELQVRVFDVTHTSFRLSWPRLLSLQQERYILEYSLESDVRRSLRKSLPASQTEVLVGNLSPSTTYRVTLTPESNEHLIRPKTIQVSTLPEQLGPSQILISEPTSNSFRVSWGPHLDNVAGYEIQYGPLPSNTVYKVLLDSTINSTVLENLQPNTTYLVTVAARFKDGREKGLSAIACTEEKDVKVSYLRLEDLGSDNLRAIWGSADGNVQGYRVRCRRQARKSSVVNVAPQTHSMVFKDMTSGSINQICVKPIYKDRTGKDLCRRFHTHPATPAEVYPRLRT